MLFFFRSSQKHSIISQVFKVMTSNNKEADTLFELLFLNNMKLTQAFALENKHANLSIKVPFETPSTQWHLLDLPSFDSKNNSSRFSYYDGFQLYPLNKKDNGLIQKRFKNLFKVQGPKFSSFTHLYNDETYIQNKVQLQ